jgi:hypothetical protein
MGVSVKKREFCPTHASMALEIIRGVGDRSAKDNNERMWSGQHLSYGIGVKFISEKLNRDNSETRQDPWHQLLSFHAL